MKVALIAALAITSTMLVGIPTAGQERLIASVKAEKFDPPAVLDDDNQLVEVVAVMHIPGSPGLVLHIPCLRSKLSSNNGLAAGRLVAPGVVEGCFAQKIPSGQWAGEYVKEDGEIFPIPRENN